MECWYFDDLIPKHEYKGILKHGDACIKCLRFPKEIFINPRDKFLSNKEKSGLRKCKGHKYGTTYTNNKCDKCGGYK